MFLCLHLKYQDADGYYSVRLMYATGARLLQSTALPGLHAPEVYYAKAMEYLDNIVTLHNLANVQGVWSNRSQRTRSVSLI